MTLVSEVTTVVVMAQTILQLALLAGGAMVAGLVVAVVFHVLGPRDEDVR